MTTLIKVAEDCPVSKAVMPTSVKVGKTLPILFFEELIKNPYFYTPEQIIRRVHVEIRNKTKLKLPSYSIRRNPLLKQFGWGFHIDERNRIAVVGCDSAKYKALLEDASVKKVNAYKNRKL